MTNYIKAHRRQVRGFATLALALAVALGLGLAFAGAGGVFAEHGGGGPYGDIEQNKVKICHWNSSDGGSYITNEPSVNSILNLNDSQGNHGSHGEDIIPPFHYNDRNTTATFFGRNWDQWDNPPAGYEELNPQDIWNSEGCGLTPDQEVQTGTIIIEKQAEPDASQQVFDFNADWINGDTNFTLSDDGVETFDELDADTYVVTELIPSGWELTGLTCDDDNSQVDVGSGAATINLEEGETVSCVFTNTQNGSITVEKTATPSDTDATFDFEGDVSGTLAHGKSATETVPPGQYSSTELVPEGWDLTSIQCDDTDSTGDIETGTVTFNVEAGEAVTCTFTNIEKTVPTGTIVVAKVVEGGSSTTTPFGFDASWLGGSTDFELRDGEVSTSTGVVVGQTHFVSEIVPLGWESDGGVCTSTDDADQSTPEAIDLSEGETVTCTFTNSESILETDLEVLKEVDTATTTEGSTVEYKVTVTNNGPDDATGVVVTDTFPVGMTVVGAGATTGSYDSSTGEWTVGSLVASSTETLTINARVDVGTAGQILENVAVVSGDQNDPNETNDTSTARVEIEQIPVRTFLLEGTVWNDENENGVFDEETESPLGGWVISATDGEDIATTTSDGEGYYFFLVPAGTWTISEEVQPDWQQTFPDGDGVHVVTVPTPEVTLNFPMNLFATVAYAQTPSGFGPFNFGNVLVSTPPSNNGGSTSSGGGGSRAPRSTSSGGDGDGDGDGDVAGTSTPQVLGDQVVVVPQGAPNTGFGGMAPADNTFTPFIRLFSF